MPSHRRSQQQQQQPERIYHPHPYRKFQPLNTTSLTYDGTPFIVCNAHGTAIYASPELYSLFSIPTDSSTVLPNLGDRSVNASELDALAQSIVPDVVEKTTRDGRVVTVVQRVYKTSHPNPEPHYGPTGLFQDKAAVTASGDGHTSQVFDPGTNSSSPPPLLAAAADPSGRQNEKEQDRDIPPSYAAYIIQFRDISDMLSPTPFETTAVSSHPALSLLRGPKTKTVTTTSSRPSPDPATAPHSTTVPDPTDSISKIMTETAAYTGQAYFSALASSLCTAFALDAVYVVEVAQSDSESSSSDDDDDDDDEGEERHGHGDPFEAVVRRDSGNVDESGEEREE
ncbi:hypothetical protein HK104_000104, partial [Borealophlyctis nickersoniae]